MKIDWIRFHGIYGDCEYAVGTNGVRELRIESYCTEPGLSACELRMECDGDVVKVRSLDGANYDYQRAVAGCPRVSATAS